MKKPKYNWKYLITTTFDYIIPTETRSKTNVKYTAKHFEKLSQKQCKKLRSGSKMWKSTEAKTLENSAAS